MSNGRSITAPPARYTRLEHGLLESAAYHALSPNARSLLTQMATLENGKNNGLIWLSVRDAAARMGVANLRSAAAAFDQLQDLGFIVCTKQAHFLVRRLKHQGRGVGGLRGSRWQEGVVLRMTMPSWNPNPKPSKGGA